MQIKANDIQIDYELSGSEGTPVLAMSHSLGSGLEMRNPQMELLEPHYRILRYDTRGHGGSQATEGAYTLNLLAKDAIGLMDALGMQKVIWIGLKGFDD